MFQCHIFFPLLLESPSFCSLVWWAKLKVIKRQLQPVGPGHFCMQCQKLELLHCQFVYDKCFELICRWFWIETYTKLTSVQLKLSFTTTIYYYYKLNTFFWEISETKLLFIISQKMLHLKLAKFCFQVEKYLAVTESVMHTQVNSLQLAGLCLPSVIT